MIVEDSGEDDDSCQGDVFFGEGGGLLTAGQLRDSCNSNEFNGPGCKKCQMLFGTVYGDPIQNSYIDAIGLRLCYNMDKFSCQTSAKATDASDRWMVSRLCWLTPAVRGRAIWTSALRTFGDARSSADLPARHPLKSLQDELNCPFKQCR